MRAWPPRGWFTSRLGRAVHACPPSTTEERPWSGIETILCPIDFSACSRHAFDTAVAIAARQRASVTAIHVAPFQAIPVFPYTERAAEEALMRSAGDSQKLIDEVQRFLAVDKSTAVPITCEVRDAPNIHHEILGRADTLAAESHSHGHAWPLRLSKAAPGFSHRESAAHRTPAGSLTVGAASDELPAAAGPSSGFCVDSTSPSARWRPCATPSHSPSPRA